MTPSPHIILLCRCSKTRQRGSTFLVVVILIGFVMLTVIVGGLDARRIKIDREKKTSQALAEAKAALIAYTLQRGSATGNERPGEFPCPDRNEDGLDNDGACNGGELGRIPWKTLGISELKDDSGETLWYAVADLFRSRPSGTRVINSDTKPSNLMSVYAGDGQTLITPTAKEAVVVIFSSGAAIGGQVRQTQTQRRNAVNYLESAGTLTTRNNATTNGPFISAPKSDAFNDRLIVITRDDFMPALEKRVATVLQSGLAAYKTANGVYPYPANYTNADCRQTTFSLGAICISDITQCRGRIPRTALPAGWPANSLPDWFLENRWNDVIYYAVGTDSFLAAGLSVPVNCSSFLTVDSTANVTGLFFMPGVPLGIYTRPNSNLYTYLEDVANQDGWTGTAPSADIYITPTSSSNDRLYQLP